VIPGHEPNKANDGGLRSYWVARPEALPADLGVEWPAPQTISSVVVRYLDGHSRVLGPDVARTQQWTLLQYWVGRQWRDIDARLFGGDTSTARYVFTPITTTRVRLLFTEPPDPEFRDVPARAEIDVCEFEAYRDPPFQWVTAPDRVVRRERRQFNYDAPVHGDSSFDLEQPLIIAPEQTHVFTDALSPTLIISETHWAHQPCAVTRPEPGTIRLSNGFLSLDVDTRGELRETRLNTRVTDESLATPQSEAFLIRIDVGTLTPKDFRVVKVDSTASNTQASQVTIELEGEKLAITAHYERRERDHFYHKWLTLTNWSASPLMVRDVTLSNLGLPRPLDLSAGPELSYPICRLKKGGFFECLETVYWDHELDAMTYYPGRTVAPQAKLDTEKAVVRVYQNRGETIAGWDRGVREWVTEYQDHVSPLPEQWPDVYCEGWSADIGVRQLIERPEWTDHEFAIAEKLGIRYMDAYQPIHQAMVMPEEWVKRWLDLSNAHHIETGWWPDFGSGDDWGTGEPLMPHASLVSPAGKAYIQRMEEFVNKYQLKGMHWGDFLQAWPAQNPGPGVLPGKYAIYAQGQEIINFNRDLHRLSPGIMLGGDCSLTTTTIAPIASLWTITVTFSPPSSQTSPSIGSRVT
jgi:hypothetical protein